MYHFPKFYAQKHFNFFPVLQYKMIISLLKILISLTQIFIPNNDDNLTWDL